MNAATKTLLAVCGFALLLYLASLKSPFETPPEFAHSYQGEVVLYATAWCGYCKKTRELLQHNNIKYKEYDIEKSAEGRRRYDQLNGRGVPLLVIEDQVVRGYNPGLIQEILQGG